MHLHRLDDWNMTCPCGARTESAYSLCRKCRSRAAWRRRKARKSWRSRISTAVRRNNEFIESAREVCV